MFVTAYVPFILWKCARDAGKSNVVIFHVRRGMPIFFFSYEWMLAQVIEVIGKIIGPFVLAAHRHRIAPHIVFHTPSSMSCFAIRGYTVLRGSNVPERNTQCHMRLPRQMCTWSLVLSFYIISRYNPISNSTKKWNEVSSARVINGSRGGNLSGFFWIGENNCSDSGVIQKRVDLSNVTCYRMSTSH